MQGFRTDTRLKHWIGIILSLAFAGKDRKMTDDKKQSPTSGSQIKSDSNNVHGRIHNSQNPNFDQKGTRNDISSVDQQEGNMDHGECGGNLKPENT